MKLSVTNTKIEYKPTIDSGKDYWQVLDNHHFLMMNLKWLIKSLSQFMIKTDPIFRLNKS